MSRAKLGTAARITATVVMLVVLALVIHDERHALSRALDMGTREFSLIALFTLTTWCVTTASHWHMLRALRAPVPMGNLLALHAVSGLLNHLPLRAGTVYRAHYLKRRAGVHYTHYGSFMVINAAVMTFASGALGAVTVWLEYGIAEPAQQGLFVGFVVLAVAGAAPLVVPLPRSTRDGRWANRWNQFVLGRDRLMEHPTTAAVLLVRDVLAVGLAAARYFVAFQVIDVSVGFVGCVVLGATGRLSLILGITPAGLGIQEISVAGCAYLLGVSLGTAVVAATLARAVIIVLYVACGVPALIALRHAEPRDDARDSH